MASTPTAPRLFSDGRNRRRWVSFWYDDAGKHRSKVFGFEEELTEIKAGREYTRWLAKWNTRTDMQTPPSKGDGVYTVCQLAARYLRYARTAFVKDGKPTSHVTNVRMAMRELRDAHGDEPADSLEAPVFAAFRDRMIWRKDQKGHRVARAAKTVNDRLTIIVAAYDHARESGLVSRETVADLKSVKHLRKGRSQAKASKKIRAIHESVVQMTLTSLSPMIADMVRVLNITGMRPEEICTMRGCEIEMAGDLWLYRPRHKLEHMEGDSEVVRFIGPRAQEIIRPYITRKLGTYLFSPADAYAAMLEARRAARKSKRWESHAKRLKQNPVASRGDHYTTESLRRAIHRACTRSGIEKWNPNQLRHSVATRMADQYGIQSASVQLGHKNLSTTQIYAWEAAQLAMKLAREVG